jgi:hypothetical protein
MRDAVNEGAARGIELVDGHAGRKARWHSRRIPSRSFENANEADAQDWRWWRRGTRGEH